MTEVKRDNHYLPQFYLAGWADEAKRVCTYPVLVSNAQVPPWRPRSIKGIAYHQHLYTRMSGEGEVDDIERWLDREFEAPGREVVEKVREDKRLTPTDWRVLARYVASQDVRTPASFIRSMRRWEKELPGLINSVLEEAVEELKREAESDAKAPENETAVEARPRQTKELRDEFTQMVPMRLSKEIEPGAAGGFLKLEVTTGRALWLFQIRHLLNGVYRVLEEHHWEIARPAEGTEWFTTDDPVVKLNYTSRQDYNFEGGWGSKGTEIFMPLSPNHLLYTQVGKKHRASRFEPSVAAGIRRLIAEHAHRYVFASHPRGEVLEFRPRVVDPEQYKNERRAWEEWHSQQSDAELSLGTDDPNGEARNAG